MSSVQQVVQVGIARRVVQVGIQGAPGRDGGSSSLSLEVGMIESDLTVAGMKLVTHGFSERPSSVSVCRPDGEEVFPERIQHFSENALGVYVENFRPLVGIWTIKVGA